MRQTIRVEDKDADGVLIGLPRILDILEPEGSQMRWAMFDLWVTGNLPEGKNVLDLEQESRTAAKGVRLTWRELRDFAEAVTQVIEGVFVGCADTAGIPDRSASGAIRKCDVVIEAVDSSFWEVTAQNDQLVKRLQSAFPKAPKVKSVD